MADDDEIDLSDLDVGDGDKKKGKKWILFIALPILLLGIVGAALYFSGMLSAPAEQEAQAPVDIPGDQSTGIFFDVQDVIVNLNTRGDRQRLLKIGISLELSSEEDKKTIETMMPRVMDHFQTYLRELRVEDVQGSAGIYRLRLELLARVNAAAKPVVVRDILFREILIQ